MAVLRRLARHVPIATGELHAAAYRELADTQRFILDICYNEWTHAVAADPALLSAQWLCLGGLFATFL